VARIRYPVAVQNLQAPAGSAENSHMPRRLVLALALVLPVVGLAILYQDVIAKLVHDWSVDENYSHGFLIVPIALYLAWERRNRLAAATARPSVLGLLTVLGSIVVLAAGTLGAELFLTRISLLGVLAGLILFVLGWQHLRILAFPLAFLLLMIPIPAIIFNQIAFPLQLLASRFGELTLAAVGIPVLREGNVITLSNTTLEVAEACSGIRSLVSLLTLAIVYGYVVEARTWARIALALASVPVAIVANGVRVAGTGIAAHFIGPDAAQGFFHTFSGWLVFIVAFILLFAVQRVIARIGPRSRKDMAVAQAVGASARLEAVTSASSAATSADNPPAPPSGPTAPGAPNRLAVRAVVVAVCLVIGSAAIARASKSEPTLPRQSFSTFPMQLGSWQGQSADRFDQRVLTVLGVDEYINRIYSAPGHQPVGVYIGFYQSQREGDTMHSPLNCLPGAGWEPVARSQVPLTVKTSTDPGALTTTIAVNRIVIEKGLDRQLVLYWYQSHGRVVASEYWGKVFTVLDAIRLNRTDAAMVRIISPIANRDRAAERDAERAAFGFVQDMFPQLSRYLPE
jgi:EpsI family protein